MSIVFKDFGTAYLAAPLAVGGLTITVDNALSLPILANGDYFYLVLQKYSDRSYVEIVKVTATAGNTLTILRGQAGTSIRAFAVGDYAELRLTTDALTEYIAQSISTKMDKSGGGDFSGLYRFLNPSVSRIEIVRTSDSVASSLVVDYSASEGHRTIVGGATGSNVETPSILIRPNGYGNGTGQVKIDGAGLVDAVSFSMRGAQRTEAGAAVRYDYLGNFVPVTRKVNGRELTADVTLTPSDVKAAPEGFGLGETQAFTVADMDSDPLTWNGGKMGWIRAISSSTGKPDDQAGVGLLHRYQSGASSIVHVLFFGHNNKMYTRRWSGTAWSVWKTSFDSTNKPAIADVTGLSDALAQSGSSPVLSTAWVQLRTAMWNGYVAADGQLLKRVDYPDAWKAIEAGKVPVVSDVDWNTSPANRGCFTAGDGSTTFRVPDYNGAQPGGYGPVYLGGGSTDGGTILRDRMQNITGSFNTATGADGYGIATREFSGAFKAGGGNGSYLSRTQSAVQGVNESVVFDASRVARTGDTTRPITVEGCWAVKLFGAVQNAGSIDAAGLATQIAELQAPRPINSINWQGAVAFRNLLINGDFRIWQRGTSHDWTVATAKFAADRWNVNFTAAGSALLTPVATRMLGKASAEVSLVGKAAGSQFYMYQRLEDAMAWALRGKKATLSFVAKASSPVSLTATLHKPSNGYNDWTATTQLESTSFNITTTAQRFTFTTSVLDGDKAAFGLQVMFNAVLGTGTLQITEVQLEVGDAATPYEYRPLSYELQLCRRYFNAIRCQFTGALPVSQTSFSFPSQLPVEMYKTLSVAWNETYKVPSTISFNVARVVTGSLVGVLYINNSAPAGQGADIDGVLYCNAEI